MAITTVKVHEVLADTNHAGPAGDGTVIFRFKRLADAEAFAKIHTCYGRPATIMTSDVPRRIATRWSYS